MSLKKLSSSQSVLKGIWDKIGFSEEDQKSKWNEVMDRLDAVLDDVIDNAEKHANSIFLQVEQLETKTRCIYDELGLQFEPLPVKMTLNSALTEATERLHKIQVIRDHRYEEKVALLREKNELSDKLGVEKSFDDACGNYAPLSEETLSDLSNRIGQLREKEAKRFEVVVSCQSIIQNLTRIKKYDVTTELENDLLVKNAKDVSLSDESMKQLEDLREKLNEVYQRVLKELPKIYEEKCGNVLFWRKKCYLGVTSARRFEEFDAETFNVDVLERLDDEIERLEQYYKERSKVFQLYDTWEDLWYEKLKLEEASKDPTRFANRGGILLREERQRKSVESKLKRACSNVVNAAEEWKALHGGSAILIQGNDVKTHIDQTILVHQQQKAIEIVEKKMLKERQFAADYLSTTEMLSSSQSQVNLSSKKRKGNVSPIQNWSRSVDAPKPPKQNRIGNVVLPVFMNRDTSSTTARSFLDKNGNVEKKGAIEENSSDPTDGNDEATTPGVSKKLTSERQSRIPRMI